MTLAEYHETKEKAGYREHLDYIVGSETSLRSFVIYEFADLDLKIHLAKVILQRHFPSTGGTVLPQDVEWFIDAFLKEFKTDLIKPWISKAVKRSIRMVNSKDTFSRVIIGTTFLFGVLEFHAKYRLGWRPEQHDVFDTAYHDKYRSMHLRDAINKVKKIDCDLARDLNAIDKYNVEGLKEAGITEQRFTIPRIGDRLTFARNQMLHGETHAFYSAGQYMSLIYILFHLHSTKDGLKYEGN